MCVCVCTHRFINTYIGDCTYVNVKVRMNENMREKEGREREREKERKYRPNVKNKSFCHV